MAEIVMDKNPDSPYTLPLAEERSLLEAVAEGDRAAFTRLYRDYLPITHQYISRHLDFNRPDIEEVAQEIFFKIWKKKETLIAIRCFEKFLFIVARNTLTDFFRSRKASQTRNRSLADNWTPPEYPAEERLITSEYLGLTRKALELMPVKRRRVFELRIEQELSLEDIAVTLNMSVSGVHRDLRKAVESIKTYFHRHGSGLQK